MKTTIQDVHKAIYIINIHAKNAPALYPMKQRAIQKLLKEGRAVKIGLTYSPNPGNALQRLDVLIRVGDFLFHLPSTKEDRRNLEILEDDPEYRNPKVYMPLKRAKRLLELYSPLLESPVDKEPLQKQPTTYIGLSGYLNGKVNNGIDAAYVLFCCMMW
ncbi:YkyB family protein [Fictibacillus sp. B-59209]|uniref:YkyB family protein n=1 Tax=Fictibacillus sp. B-59209 TaxID=3024873 RepID=UPI002E1E12D8|nr:YkyB family protein [Fictibacillus sp. B-59209]